MHSRVFQFEDVKKSEYDDNDIELFTEGSIESVNEFPDANYVDYWGMSPDDPEEDFAWLVKCLPEGMFEVDEENLSLKYVAVPVDYLDGYIQKLQDAVGKLSTSELKAWNTWDLLQLVRNNKQEFMIYTSKNGYPEYIHDWIVDIAKYGEIGHTYYMGGVVDYHM